MIDEINAGALWSAEEDARLLREIEVGTSIERLAVEHGRTEAAITTRLVRHNRLYRNPITGAYHRIERPPFYTPTRAAL